jgi:integrase
VLGLRWEELDLGAGIWNKPASRVKQRKRHRLPLSAPLRALLAERLKRREGDTPWVFPGRNGQPRQDLKFAWKRICKAAGVSGLRVHDLRHSHASFLVSAGYSLPVISRLLGHSQVSTSARYAHLFDSVEREATERLGAIVTGGEGGDVVPLNRRGRR